MDEPTHTPPEPVSPDAELAPTEHVRQALDDVTPAREAEAPDEQAPATRRWLAFDVLLVLCALAARLALEEGWLPVAHRYLDRLEHLSLGVAWVAAVLAFYRIADRWGLGRIEDAALRYNVRRIVKLAVGLLIAAVLLSVLFANWIAAATSLGVASLILGFALQTPITSFIGWIYILARRPFRVGDRIMINNAIGDVIDVSYFDTTLWEVGGQGLSADAPSGRIIKFPNNQVLQNAVYNYSWPLFPYVWNEVTFHVAYQSDLAFIEQVMREVVQTELGDSMMQRARQFRDILSQTPVDEVTVRDRPSVNFRANANTWLEATVRYIVPPREASRVKTRLVRRLLERLNAEPEKVLFPAGNNR